MKRANEAAVHIRSARRPSTARAPAPMPFAMKMAFRTRKDEKARAVAPLQVHKPAVELSETDRRWSAENTALKTFNSIWREEMAQLTALRAASDTLREEIATASTPTVVTCAKCKQVVTGCPRVHFREKHAAP